MNAQNRLKVGAAPSPSLPPLLSMMFHVLKEHAGPPVLEHNGLLAVVGRTEPNMMDR